MESQYLQALARCVRVSIGLDSGPVALDSGIDPERLADQADHHNLLGHAATAGAAVPRDWRLRWARASLTLASEAARLAGIFEAAGIRAMPLKGPALSSMLYGDPGRRQYSDLDIMVEPHRAAAAQQALRTAGYEAKWHGRAAAHQTRFNWYEEVSMRHARSGIDVDLHWSFTPRHYLARMDDVAVWRKAESVEFLGRAVDVPAPEDYFEYLCLHGARHEWSRLGWLADLAAFRVRYGHRIDWKERLARPGSGALLAEALRLCSDWLGEPRADFVPGAPVSTWRKLRYRAAVLVIPTEADWAGGGLPPSLGFLYYPLRMKRLVQRRLRGLD